jgi:LuxR family transcriptional regulator, maltose regulon positive regulatory protein
MSAILETKFHIPQVQANFIHRQQLLSMIERDMQSKLILVTAPAGFGKTTLVTMWLDALRKGPAKKHIAWVSLDAGDNSLRQFWIYVVHSIQQISPEIGKSCQTGLNASDSIPIETILIPLLNDLAEYNGSIVLVLDDYHEIQQTLIHDSMAFFIDRLPANCHVVIATRMDPPIPISRLRVRGQITEIRSDELRFTKAEVNTFFENALGAALDEDDTEAIIQRTEGWPAGLQLASLSLRNAEDKSAFIRDFSGSHRYLVDYLVEEILSRQDQDTKQFLWRTSILDRFCVEVCDVLTEHQNAQQMIRRLEQSNLFLVQLDHERKWFRYHHLFAEFLNLYLQENEPETISSLYEKAIIWFADKNLLLDAINLAIKFRNDTLTADLIEKIAPEILENENHMQLLDWTAQFPQVLIHQRPYLCVYLAWTYVLSGKLNTAEEYLLLAESNLLALPKEDQEIIKGHIQCHFAYIQFMQGKFKAAIPAGEEALQKLPTDKNALRIRTMTTLGNAYHYNGQLNLAKKILLEAVEKAKEICSLSLTNIGYCALGEIYRDEAKLSDALAAYENILQYAEEKTGTKESSFTGYAILEIGVIARAKNDLDFAVKQIRKGVRLCKQWYQGEATAIGLLELAEAYRLRGEYDEADSILAEGEEVAKNLSQWAEQLARGMRARNYLSKGETEKAIQWVYESGLMNEQCEISYDRLPESHAFIRTLILMEKADVALKYLDNMIARDKPVGRFWRVMDSLVLKFLCLHALNKTEEALEALAEAVRIATPEKIVQPFLNDKALLVSMLPKLPASEFRDALINICSGKQESGFIGAVIDDVDVLNEREIEILQLMATGKSNREISDVLYLSVNTIRWYASQIYIKMGVKGRGEAVALAREQNLI